MSRARGKSLRRGQPIAVLLLILFGWVATRAALWEAPFAAAQGIAHAQLIATGSSQIRPKRSALVQVAAETPAHRAMLPQPSPSPTAWPMVASVAPLAAPLPEMPSIKPAAQPATPVPLSPRVAAGHQLLWLAAVAQLPLPAVLFDRRGDAPLASISSPLAPQKASAKRWSADGWLLLRRGGTSIAQAGFSAPSYGASQIGAVIRYRLAPDNPRRPAAYLRATGAVRAPHDAEVAAGFAARPLARLPVVALAELRAAQLAGGTRLRPAVALVSEFPPLELPLGVRAEAYGQAGYVGGAGASYFADGQLHLTRRLARIGGAELRAGGAAWGGAQTGAARVDIGPTASLGLPVGPANTRLSADWRFRVAGSAVPGSGPALTLSAGF